MRTAALLLLGCGVALSLLNWVCLFRFRRIQRHIYPVIPVPSVLTALGLALLDETRRYCWIGLLTDYTFMELVIAAPSWLAGAWRTSSFTRVRRLRAEDAPRRFELSLHRGGHFVLRARFDPAVPCDRDGACITWFGAMGRWQGALDERLRLWGYRQERVLTLQRANSDFLAREECYPESKEFPFDSLDGLRFRAVV